jgi:hypothetical protein
VLSLEPLRAAVHVPCRSRVPLHAGRCPVLGTRTGHRSSAHVGDAVAATVTAVGPDTTGGRRGRMTHVGPDRLP